MSSPELPRADGLEPEVEAAAPQASQADDSASPAGTGEAQGGAPSIAAPQQPVVVNVTVTNPEPRKPQQNVLQTAAKGCGQLLRGVGVVACFVLGIWVATEANDGAKAFIKRLPVVGTEYPGPSPLLSWKNPKDKADSVNPSSAELDDMSEMSPKGCYKNLCVLKIDADGNAIIIVPGSPADVAVAALKTVPGGCISLKTTTGVSGSLQTANGVTLKAEGGIKC